VVAAAQGEDGRRLANRHVQHGVFVMKRRDVLKFGLVSITAGVLKQRQGFAQSKYPERPVKLVIPFVPGGGTDTLGRLWVDKMKALLGPVFIENQGGGGGTVGAAAVARALPDGYTILLTTGGSQVLVRAGASQAPYDPAKDFEPIAILGVTALTIVTHPLVPARTLQELVEHAKANRGQLSYGSAGPGTMTHLAGELFKSLTGTADIVHIAYKGGGQLIADVIGGHIPIVVLNVTGQVIELHRAGKLRMLAVTSPTRVAAGPDIPTAVEAGLPGMIAQNFFALFAPAGTSKAIVAQLSDATRRALAEEEFRRKLIASGFEPHLDSTPEAARRFVEEEVGRWTPVIKAIGLKLD
jgi:tripartite-type tricarboxylate transporter receptor subunit TctC